jgi:hypothetical protein
MYLEPTRRRSRSACSRFDLASAQGMDRSSCRRRTSLPILEAPSSSDTAARTSPNSYRAHGRSSYSDTCLRKHLNQLVLDSP